VFHVWEPRATNAEGCLLSLHFYSLLQPLTVIMIQIAEILQGIAVGANSSFVERVVSVGVGAGVALSVTKMWKVQPPAKADQVDRPTAITTSPSWVLDVKHARLVLLGILVMCGVFVRHELWELRRQTLPVGSVTAFAGDATQLATLAEQGWAVCDGRSSEEQGITHAKVPNTPDLSARYLEGATANDFKQLKPAHFPVLQATTSPKEVPARMTTGSSTSPQMAPQ
jgi:hypothetical protein